ncbi:MAG: nitrogen regulation protein NR(II) [SAR86 cluster bacterium]|nr:nitrogen regulation protein NR(II) [SAR86 cluster bacterium]
MNQLNHFLFTELTTGILVLDSSLSIKLINTSAESFLDSSLKSTTGKKITDLFHEEPDSLENFENCLEKNRDFKKIDAILHLRKGRTLLCDYTLRPFSNAEFKECLIMEIVGKENASEIKERHRMKTNQEITTEFIRGMAHEIKNPLSGIRGSAQLLNNKLPDQNLREYTDIIIKQTDRLTVLVDNILGPNKKPSFKVQNIHYPIENVMDLEKNEIKDIEIKYEKDFDPSIPDLLIDSYLIENSVLNLIKNARESLSNSKTLSPKIKVKTRVVHQEYIGELRFTTLCKISISDNGPGIPEDIKDSIFFPMISGKEQGSGLGLSITQGIVSQHNGALQFRSKPGDTEFSIIIPISANMNSNDGLKEAHG